jgi:membrane protein DedA with SNARE-associated domain
MSEDLKNSILLWVGTVVFVGLFWASLQVDVIPDIPTYWNWAIPGILIVLNVLKAIWDCARKRKARNR